jgi:hypothetical protein
MMEILFWLLLAGIGWFVHDSLGARELARVAGRRACDSRGVQFLDDTVAGTHTGLARNDRGTLVFKRTYRFEFSDTGDNRREGRLAVTGNRVTPLEMDDFPADDSPSPPLARNVIFMKRD